MIIKAESDYVRVEAIEAVHVQWPGGAVAEGDVVKIVLRSGALRFAAYRKKWFDAWVAHAGPLEGG